MAYAIIRSGGKQFRIEPNQTVQLPLIGKHVGDAVDLEVLAVGGDDGAVKIGAPFVEGAQITAKVVAHGRAPKIIVFKKKRRKQYKRTKGHRQDFTAVKIESIG